MCKTQLLSPLINKPRSYVLFLKTKFQSGRENIIFCDKALVKPSMLYSRTLGMIKPDAVGKVGQILDAVFQSGFKVTRMKMCRLSRNEAFSFYAEHQGKAFFECVDFKFIMNIHIKFEKS